MPENDAADAPPPVKKGTTSREGRSSAKEGSSSTSEGCSSACQGGTSASKEVCTGVGRPCFNADAEGDACEDAYEAAVSRADSTSSSTRREAGSRRDDAFSENARSSQNGADSFEIRSRRRRLSFRMQPRRHHHRVPRNRPRRRRRRPPRRFVRRRVTQSRLAFDIHMDHPDDSTSTGLASLDFHEMHQGSKQGTWVTSADPVNWPKSAYDMTDSTPQQRANHGWAVILSEEKSTKENYKRLHVARHFRFTCDITSPYRTSTGRTMRFM